MEQRMDVPFVDLRMQARELHDEFAAAFESVISRAAYTLGPEVGEFEAAFAAVAGCAHAIGVSSGTDALKLALLAAGVSPGDEVALPANTFIATAEAVSHIGAVPVFVDCDPETALIDPDALAETLDEHEGLISAVIPVHLYGQACEMDRVMQLATAQGLAVVEDACQAHGAAHTGRPCGSMGVTAAFSFYPGKNLGALGDGGAITTNDESLAEQLRLLRNHGQVSKQTHAFVGYCDRLHNLQAALLNVKLPHLAEWNVARRRAAAYYTAGLAGLAGVRPVAQVPWGESVYHLYVVELEDEALEGVRAQPGTADDPAAPYAVDAHHADARGAVRSLLQTTGVQSGVHYAVPLHLQPAYAALGYQPGAFPGAERLADRIVSLPMFPEITTAQQDFVIESLAAALR